MKAQFVYEALDFERGRDPKDAMSIGTMVMIKNWIEKNTNGFKEKDYLSVLASNGKTQ